MRNPRCEAEPPPAATGRPEPVVGRGDAVQQVVVRRDPRPWVVRSLEVVERRHVGIGDGREVARGELRDHGYDLSELDRCTRAEGSGRDAGRDAGGRHCGDVLVGVEIVGVVGRQIRQRRRHGFGHREVGGKRDHLGELLPFDWVVGTESAVGIAVHVGCARLAHDGVVVAVGRGHVGELGYGVRPVHPQRVSVGG